MVTGDMPAARLPQVDAAGRIVDRVHTALRDAILSGNLRSGSQLSVPELARQLNVSRSPVREAVLQLVSGGLAVEQPRKGVVVALIEREDLAEIHEIREALEALAARRCAERAPDAAIVSLASILDRQREAITAVDAEGYFTTNAAFHRAIAQASGNGRLFAFQALLEDQMGLALRHVARKSGHMEAGFKEHQRILRAIRARDTEKAEAAMRTHIANTSLRLREL
jgi:DNA-binding GntR family transcriptional regulator